MILFFENADGYGKCCYIINTSNLCIFYCVIGHVYVVIYWKSEKNISKYIYMVIYYFENIYLVNYYLKIIEKTCCHFFVNRK